MFWSGAVLEWWCFGMVVFWSDDALEWWCLGVVVSWSGGVLEWQCFGVAVSWSGSVLNLQHDTQLNKESKIAGNSDILFNDTPITPVPLE